MAGNPAPLLIPGARLPAGRPLSSPGGIPGVLPAGACIHRRRKAVGDGTAARCLRLGMGDPAGWRSGDERAAQDSQRRDRRRRAGSRPSRRRGAHAEPGNVTGCRAHRSRRRYRARQHDLAAGRRGDRRGKSRRSRAGRQRSAGSSLWRFRDRSAVWPGRGRARHRGHGLRPLAGRTERLRCVGRGELRRLPAPTLRPGGLHPTPVLRGERIGEEDQVGEVQGEVHQDARLHPSRQGVGRAVADPGD